MTVLLCIYMYLLFRICIIFVIILFCVTTWNVEIALHYKWKEMHVSSHTIILPYYILVSSLTASVIAHTFYRASNLLFRT